MSLVVLAMGRGVCASFWNSTLPEDGSYRTADCAETEDGSAAALKPQGGTAASNPHTTSATVILYPTFHNLHHPPVFLLMKLYAGGRKKMFDLLAFGLGNRNRGGVLVRLHRGYLSLFLLLFEEIGDLVHKFGN